MARTTLIPAAAIAFLATFAGAQTIADISAVTNDPANPVTVRLGAGVWRAVPIDMSQGGAYTAWHAWNGANTGCGATPGSCTQGWIWTWFLQIPGQTAIHVRTTPGGGPVPKFTTAQDAFDLSSIPLWLPIATPTNVTLWIGDSNHADNLGGVSVRFEQVTRVMMTADVPTISMQTGGAQRFAIDGSMLRAGHVYFVLGSSSGTMPGLRVDPWTLPLNGPDPYLGYTAASANTTYLIATFGMLDALGQANARLQIPGPQNPAVAGLVLHHAVVTFENGWITGISDPVRVDFVR